MAAFGTSDLRTFCRQMGVPVSFQGVAVYADGQPVMGLFDAASQDALFDQLNVGDERYSLELPFNAFNPMPDTGDTVRVLGGVRPGEYVVRNLSTLDDGSMVQFSLKAR